MQPDLKTRNGLRASSIPQMLIELAPLDETAPVGAIRYLAAHA